MKTENPIDCYDGESGAIILRMSREDALSCSGQGAQDDNVASLLASGRVEFCYSDLATIRRFLRGYGAWEDLDEADEDTLRSRALWILACDAREGRFDEEDEEDEQ